MNGNYDRIISKSSGETQCYIENVGFDKFLILNADLELMFDGTEFTGLELYQYLRDLCEDWQVANPDNSMKERRNNCHMTQQALADYVGCRRETIVKIESGEYNPSLQLADRIATALRCTVYEIFNLQSLSAYMNDLEGAYDCGFEDLRYENDRFYF